MNLLKRVYSSGGSRLLNIIAVKRIKTIEKCIYLTFDDGPECGITEFVLSTLDKYDARATFFCCGQNIVENEKLYYELQRKGHTIGNHTISHLKGADTSWRKYVNEVLSFREKYGTNLFRPPFMSLSLFQTLYLFWFTRIILWNVDSTDWYDKPEKEFDIDKLVDNTCNGSIILFHFCKTHQERTRIILPLYLKIMSEKGYEFKAL